jgi:intracellular multiplication protein IcmE
MTPILTKHSRLWMFRRDLLSGAGRGGPLRLVGVAGAITIAVGVVVFASIRGDRLPPRSQVAKMKAGNLLPGGLNATPAQDALLLRHSQDEARKAEEKHESYTPTMPGSVLLNGRTPQEVGLGVPADAQPTLVTATAPAPAVVDVPSPTYTAPERRVQMRDLGEARIEMANAEGGDPSDATVPSAQTQGQAAERQKAIETLLNEWSARPPQTTVVLEPAVVKEGGETSTTGKGLDPATVPERVLVPAGRGVYAHTVLAVNSDTNGPIVLEADTGPLSGDRMIGSFSKSGNDRLIVKVETVEHRGKALEVNGIVIAPDSMETAVATSVDQHYFERFVLPAAAVFVQGLGQAVAMSNSTTAISPFGGAIQTFGPMTFKEQAAIAGGAAAQAVGNALTSSIPKGPTVNLAANVSVGVMFLSNVSIK